MKKKELFSQEIDDLKKLLQKKQLEVKKTRLTITSGKDKDVKKINKLKKDIARILTVIGNKIEK